MNKNVTIYAIVRMETADAYVGSTISITDRWRTHRYELRRGKHHCRHLQNAWNRYGEDAFDFIILAELFCETREDRYILETSWIMTHGTYNVLVASDRAGVFAVTEEDREARSQAALAKIKTDPVYAAKLAKRGADLAEMQRSPEGRANMAAHGKKRWGDDAERAKIEKGLENRWAIPEARERQAETLREVRNRPEVRDNHSAILKAQWADPNSGLRNRSNGRWADPEAKARQAEKIRAAHDARRGGPKQPKPKKPKPVTMGDLILAEMRRNPARIYGPSELRRICDPDFVGTATLVTVTLGRMCQRGLVRKITEGAYGYQLAGEPQ